MHLTTSFGCRRRRGASESVAQRPTVGVVVQVTQAKRVSDIAVMRIGRQCSLAGTRRGESLASLRCLLASLGQLVISRQQTLRSSAAVAAAAGVSYFHSTTAVLIVVVVVSPREMNERQVRGGQLKEVNPFLSDDDCDECRFANKQPNRTKLKRTMTTSGKLGRVIVNSCRRRRLS